MYERGISAQYWADWFWRRASGPSGFPVDIQYAAMSALEVYVEEVEGLTTSNAFSRIQNPERGESDQIAKRRLHGCIAVSRKGAAILVEESDDEAQKRFTVAHEAAHFILEVKRRQERVESRLGHEFSDILHGRLEATPTERIDAWLRNVRSDALLHFMDRLPGGGYGCARTAVSECLADELAVEIIAPRSELIAATSSFETMSFSDSIIAAQRVAERRFGLPEEIAERHVGRALWRSRGGPSAAERFGFSD